MGVPVDEAGGDIPALQVQRLLRLLVVPHPGDAAAADGDITLVDLAGEDIDDIGVGQDEVGGGIPPRHRYQARQLGRHQPSTST